MRERVSGPMRWVGAFAVGWFLVLPASAQREPVRGAETLDLSLLDLSPLDGEVVPEILPVAAGDLVLVSSTLRLFALDAASGHEVWSSAPSTGWDALAPRERLDLAQGIDRRLLLVAPAVGQGIAVAALQLPFARSPNADWQGIPLSTALPERRLFAFELASGRPLWNHAPPAGRDWASGTLPQRMRVCGAPLVLGARVLVPCAYDESSIDYHVLCCALDTGELLWDTFVKRGQMDRNMWGLQNFEFAVAPLVAAPGGARVLAQTGLGELCALDPRDGCILWSAPYPAIPVPKVRNYAPPRRDTVWRTTPPVVTDCVVLATPWDGDALVALDLATGALLWSTSHAALQEVLGQEDLELDHLVGVADDLVLLGGTGVAAFAHAPGPDGEPLWRKQWSRVCARSSARTQLVRGRVLVPDAARILELDARTGKKLGEHAVGSVIGLAATDGTLFALTRTTLLPFSR